MKRRHFLAGVAAASLLGGTSFSSAQAAEALRIIAPAKPGGGWDQTARAISDVLAKQGVAGTTVENVPGAGGTIGLAQLIDQEKGKDTVLMVTGLVMLGAILTNKSPVTLQQTTPIARLTGEYEVIVVPAASDINKLSDLTAALKSNPGGVAIGGGSAGGTDHILAGLITKAAGGDVKKLNYVPFSGGGEALAAVLGGHVVAGISGYSEWSGQIEAGALRALAISAPTRQEGINIPTLKEGGIDVELANWRGVVAPPGLDEAATKGVQAAVAKLAASDDWKAVLKKNNWTDLFMGGTEFGAYLTAENAKVTETLKAIGLVE